MPEAIKNKVLDYAEYLVLRNRSEAPSEQRWADVSSRGTIPDKGAVVFFLC